MDIATLIERQQAMLAEAGELVRKSARRRRCWRGHWRCTRCTRTALRRGLRRWRWRRRT